GNIQEADQRLQVRDTLVRAPHDQRVVERVGIDGRVRRQEPAARRPARPCQAAAADPATNPADARAETPADPATQPAAADPPPARHPRRRPPPNCTWWPAVGPPSCGTAGPGEP